MKKIELNDMEKVTILMPVYNGEKYLQAAIDSILNQSYTNFELLIINDGSTDTSQSIIDGYSDSRINCIQQENIGVAKTLNKGLSLINTKYLRRHDADDISESNMLKEQMKFLHENPEIKFVSTSCAFMTESGKVAYNYTQPKAQLFTDNKDYTLVNHDMFNPYSPIVHGTVLGPTAIFKEMGGYREEFLTSEDNDLWLRIIEKHKFAVLRHPYYYLRLNPTSATQVHKPTISFYRDLTVVFAKERMSSGLDTLQQGKPMPKPNKTEIIKEDTRQPKGKVFRNELNFIYKVALDAKDYTSVFSVMKLAIKDGWKLKSTWKSIFFPIIGSKLVNLGVRIKRLFS